MKVVRRSLITILSLFLLLFSCLSASAEEKAPISDVVKVHCPTDYSFLLYNDEFDGRGITSRVFDIANFGNKDVLLDLSGIKLISEADVPFRELSAPIDRHYQSDSKDVFAFLKVVPVDPNNLPTPDSLNSSDLPNEKVEPQAGDYILTGDQKTTEYKILLKAANCSEDGTFLSFNPESIFSFHIAGNITPNKDLVWKKGDIVIKVPINYTLLPDSTKASSDSKPEENKAPDTVSGAGIDGAASGDSIKAATKDAISASPKDNIKASQDKETASSDKEKVN